MSENLTTDTEDIAPRAGTHFQIAVPNFSDARETGLTSYIRLGSQDKDPPVTKHGDALYKIALASTPAAAGNLAYDAAMDAVKDADPSDAATLASAVRAAVAQSLDARPGKVRGGASAALPSLDAITDAAAAAWGRSNDGDATKAAAVAAALGVFIDDTRDRGQNDDVASRTQASAELKADTGWRDHTDGNRISTTYGDKVEVIRGNFKLVVLGRQDEPTDGYVLDSSGGILQDNDAAPGQITEVKWVESGGGTWRAVETTTKGDVETTFDGKVVERFVGGSVTTIIGREDQATSSSALADTTALQAELQDAIDNGYVDKGLGLDAYLEQRGYHGGQDYALGSGSNPEVYEQTWASRIASYTGSESCPVPEIIETTYAVTIVTETTVTGILDETVTAGSILESTTAAVISSSTTVTGSFTDTVSAVDIHERLDATTRYRTETIPHVYEANIGGKWEMVLGEWGALRAGVTLEGFFGVSINFHAVADFDFSVSRFSFAALTADTAGIRLENDALNLAQVATRLEQAGISFSAAGLTVVA